MALGIRPGSRMNDRITIRLGSLVAPLAAYCLKNGRTPSEAIREILEDRLCVPRQTLTAGNPCIGEWAKAGAAARWKRAKRRTRRKPRPSKS